MTKDRRKHTPMVANTEERGEMIAVAAYYLAEHRGFTAGSAIEDWLEAEQQIDRMLETIRQQGISRLRFERAGLRNALRLWDSGQANNR